MKKDKVVERLEKIIDGSQLARQAHSLIAKSVAVSTIVNVSDTVAGLYEESRENLAQAIEDSLVLDEEKVRKIVTNALPNTSLIATEPKYIKQHVENITKAISKANIITIKGE